MVESTPGEAFGNACGTVEIEEAEAGRVDGEEMGKDESTQEKMLWWKAHLVRCWAMHVALLKLRKQKQVE